MTQHFTIKIVDVRVTVIKNLIHATLETCPVSWYGEHIGPLSKQSNRKPPIKRTRTDIRTDRRTEVMGTTVAFKLAEGTPLVCYYSVGRLRGDFVYGPPPVHTPSPPLTHTHTHHFTSCHIRTAGFKRGRERSVTSVDQVYSDRRGRGYDRCLCMTVTR